MKSVSGISEEQNKINESVDETIHAFFSFMNGWLEKEKHPMHTVSNN